MASDDGAEIIVINNFPARTNSSAIDNLNNVDPGRERSTIPVYNLVYNTSVFGMLNYKLKYTSTIRLKIDSTLHYKRY